MSSEGNNSTGGAGRLLNANTLKYLRTGATIGSALFDSFQIIQALRADIEIRKSNAHQIIRELEDEIEELEKKLRNRDSEEERRSIRQRIDVAKALIKDAKRCLKGVPSKYIKTCSGVAGKWAGGTAAGAAGAWGGAATGAFYGSFFGPAGTATGAAIGGALGGFGLGMAGGKAGRWVGEKTSDKVMDVFVDSD